MKRELKDFEALTIAEERLRDVIGGGSRVDFGDAKLPPADAGPDRTITAEFLHYLIRGGCAKLPNPVPEVGVQIAGARIIGDLNLEGVHFPRRLAFWGCRFEKPLILRASDLGSLYLDGSLIAGLIADAITVKVGIFLRERFRSTGEIRLVAARIGGSLECHDAHFGSPGLEVSLNAESIEIAGGAILGGSFTSDGEINFNHARIGTTVELLGAKLKAGTTGIAFGAVNTKIGNDLNLNEGFSSYGEVRLLGANIGGSVSLEKANLQEGNGTYALCADRAQVGGSVFFGERFQSNGEVRFTNGAVLGNFGCSGGIFSPGRDGFSLRIDGARIGGYLFISDTTKFSGIFDLTGAEIGAIVDDFRGWPAKGGLILNMCQYKAFMGKSISVSDRLDWLGIQSPDEWGFEFWPQPWEQCAKVLREMGHNEDAKAILIDKERRLRSAWRARASWWTRPWLWLWDMFLAATSRYGRQPMWAFAWLAGFWLLGAFIFGMANDADALKPNSAVVLRSPEWAACAQDYIAYRDAPRWRGSGHRSQLACFLEQNEAKAYPKFNAWIYSADTLLPIVAMEMQEFWIPNERLGVGKAARIYLWFHIAVGWLLSLLAVAGFSGLVKTD